MSIRNFSNTAVETTLTAGINNVVTSLTVNSVTGDPTVPFTIVIDPDNASKEVILVGAIAGTTLSSLTRGYNGTTAVSHSSGAVVKHEAVALDFTEANSHVNETTTAHGLTIANVLTTTNTKTMTNKTIDGASNTLSNIPQASISGLSASLAAKVAAADFAAKGSVLVGTAAGAYSSLAVGANKKAIVADTTQASGTKWAYPGMVFMGSVSPSALNTFSINSCFDSAIAEFYLIRYRLVAASGAPTLAARMRVAGVDDSSANYGYSLVIDNPTAPASSVSTAQTSIILGLLSTTRSTGRVDIADPHAAAPTGFTSHYVAGTGTPVQGWYAGFHNVNTAYDGIDFIVSGGITATGVVEVWALSNA